MKGREQKLTLRQMGAILCRAFSVSLRTKSAVTIAINLLGFGLAFLPVLAARKLQVFTDALQGYLTSDMLPLSTVIFLFLQVVTLELGRVNPWVVVAVLATSFPAAVLAYQESDDTYHTRFKWMLKGESVIKQFIAMTRPEAIKDIRHSRSYPYFKRRWRKTADGYIAKKDKLARRYLLFNSAADILRNIVFIFVLLVVCGQV